MALRIAGSVIGEPITPTPASATGMWTSQEVAALQKDGIWQAAVSYNLTASASNVNEGSVVTATLTTTGLANGTAIPYVITGANIFANDFTSGNITGDFVIQNGSNTISFTANADITLEGAETFTITAGTASANIIINDTSNDSDSQYLYTTLLLKGDGTNNAQNNTVIDSCANTLTISRSGEVTQGTFSPYGSRWSTYFSGSDGLTTPASSITTLVGTNGLNTSSVITIECWVFNTYRSGTPVIIGDGLVAGGTLNWSFGINSSGKPEVYWWTGGPNYATSTNVVPLNTWTHLAVVVNAGNIKIFINGVQETLTTSTFTNPSDGTVGYLLMGRWNTGGTGYGHYGYVSNLRIVKSALYSTTFTPSTTPLTAIANTSLLVFQDNTIKDNSVNKFTLTATNGPSVKKFSPVTATIIPGPTVTGGSAYFDGSGDYLAVSPGQFGRNDFTIEFWVYCTVSTEQVLFNNWRWYNGLTPGSIGIYYNASQVVATLYTGGPDYSYAVAADAISAAVSLYNRWTHISFTRYNGKVYLGVNGIVTTATITVDTAILNLEDSRTGYTIGYWNQNQGGPAWNFTGYMSDFRIVKGRGIYTGNYTIPSGPLTTSGNSEIYSSTANVNTSFTSANTTLLLNFTNSGIIDSSEKNNLLTVGDAKISTANSKFGGSAMFFDGTGDYLLCPSTQFPNFAFGTGDFTIECWLYQVAFSADMVIAASYTTWSSSVNFYLGTRAGSPNILIFRAGDSTPISLNGNTGLTTNTWIHIAVARASGVTRMFVGGVLQTATHTGSVNISNTVQTLGIGAANNGTEPMNGYIDDLRITNGVARYTNNFSVPTKAFVGY